MAPDSPATASAKRVVKTTKVVEQNVEVSVLGSQEDDPGLSLAQSKLDHKVNQEQATVARTVPIEDLEEEQAQNQAQRELHEVQEGQQEKNLEAQNAMPKQELMNQDQAQEELDEKSMETLEEPKKTTEAQDQAQGEAQKEQEKELAQEPNVDEPKKRTREEDEEAQQKIPTQPRKEGEAQPKKRARKAQSEAQEKPEGGERRKKKRKAKAEEQPGRQDYKRYIKRVLKTIEPELRISSGAMTVVNNFVNDIFEKLVEEASRLSVQTGKKTMTSKEIQGAVRLFLPEDLAKHALAEGNKAWANYLRFKNK